MKNRLRARASGTLARRNLDWKVTSLEPRQMLAGDAGVAIGAAVDHVAAECSPPTPAAETVATPRHLVFVDAAVTDFGKWADALPVNAELTILREDGDAIDQITQSLAGHRQVASVHIISHGRQGELRLAGQAIDRQTLEDHSAELDAWGLSLTADADLLIYGCDVASGHRGQKFIAAFARLTGADVAASIDRTGAEDRGDNWQ